MKISKFLFAAVCALAPYAVRAEIPTASSDPTACEQSSQGNCYLSDINGVNQPLDTQTRGLGVPNRLVESDMNMFVNPGQVVNYGTAYLEGWLGANLVWGGATVPLPAKQKIAVFLRRPMNANSPLGATQALFDKYPQATSLNGGGVTGYDGNFTGTNLGYLNKTAKGFGNVDLLYGITFGDLNFGLRLSYANVRNNVENTTATASLKFNSYAHNIGGGLGVQWKNLGPGYVDLALSTDIPIVKVEYNNTLAAGSESMSVKGSGPISLGALARYVMPVGQDKLILAVNMDTFKTPYEIRGASVTSAQISRDAQASIFNFAVDAAYHQNFQEGKLRIIYSAGFGSASAKYTSTDNTAGTSLEFEKTHFYVPLGVAAEHKTFESLKTRLGVRKNVYSAKATSDKTATGTTTTGTSFQLDDELTLAMGLGWTPAEKVQVDLAMNANVFNAATFFTALSARYHY